jgi:hypothetical protein
MRRHGDDLGRRRLARPRRSLDRSVASSSGGGLLMDPRPISGGPMLTDCNIRINRRRTATPSASPTQKSSKRTTRATAKATGALRGASPTSRMFSRRSTRPSTSSKKISRRPFRRTNSRPRSTKQRRKRLMSDASDLLGSNLGPAPGSESKTAAKGMTPESALGSSSRKTMRSRRRASSSATTATAYLLKPGEPAHVPNTSLRSSITRSRARRWSIRRRSR